MPVGKNAGAGFKMFKCRSAMRLPDMKRRGADENTPVKCRCRNYLRTIHACMGRITLVAALLILPLIALWSLSPDTPRHIFICSNFQYK
jgi:hypothetical protein